MGCVGHGWWADRGEQGGSVSGSKARRKIEEIDLGTLSVSQRAIAARSGRHLQQNRHSSRSFSADRLIGLAGRRPKKHQWGA